MHDLISQYRIDLEVQLGRDVSPYEARILAEEIEQHLRERVSALVELGTNPAAAQLEALAAMGPTTALRREFHRKSPTRFTLGEAAGNWLVFSVCAGIVAFSQTFLRVELFNLAMMLLWLGSPAFCRKYPWKGLVAGAILLEILLVVVPGRGQFPQDLIGIAMIFLLTAITYIAGILCRLIARKLRRRLARLN